MDTLLRRRMNMMPSGFRIFYNLTGITSSNNTDKVPGGSYTTTLSPSDSTFRIRTVTVLMGNVDITSTAYSNGVVSIANVTGNVSITALASLLPVGYTRLKYIKNTNKTYIDTNIYLSTSDHIIIDFFVLGSAARNRFLFGAWSPAEKKLWANCYHGTRSSLYPRQGSLTSNSFYYASNKTDGMGTLEILNKIWHFGGTTSTFDATNGGDFECTYLCTLFGTATSTYDSSDLCIARFCSEGKFDGYACLSSSNEVGLFDIVTQTLFKSPDNIAFEAGPNY